jgi:hypothetical protein
MDKNSNGNNQITETSLTLHLPHTPDRPEERHVSARQRIGKLTSLTPGDLKALRDKFTPSI